ncbi:site-specific DNA-methyltransferase [bacterium]|nr:site-specific DNA-methyltransferase [bacterium]
MTGIYLCDNVEGLGQVPSDSIPLTVTSPPYDRLRSYGGHGWDFEAVAAHLYRVTRPGGVVCWQVQDAIEKGVRTMTSFRQALRFTELGFGLWECLICETRDYSKSCQRQYYPTYQYVFVLAKGRPATVNVLVDRPNMYAGRVVADRHRRGRDGRLVYGHSPLPIADYGKRGTIWSYPGGAKTRDPEARKHPALMSEALARDLILTFSTPLDVVLDPFAGAGTTAKVSLLCGRRWLGFEIHAEYVKMAQERLRVARRGLWAA